MPKNDHSFEFSTNCEPAKLADYLESLAQYIRAGSVQLSAADESILLNFSPSIKLNIEAETDTKKNKSSLELAISWTPAPLAEEGGIVIQSGQDAPTPSEELLAVEEPTRAKARARSEG